MAISFVAAGTVGSGTSAAPGFPTGYAVGDLLLVFCSGSGSGPITIAPTGWTKYASTSAQLLTVFYKFATSTSEAAVTLSGGSTSCKAVIVAYRGVGAIQTAAAFTTSSTTTLTTASLTTIAANEYVVSWFGAGATPAATFSTPTGTTSRFNSGSSGSIAGLLVVDELQASAGASATRSTTLSNSPSSAAGAIALLPIRTGGVYWVGGNGTWDTSSTTNWSTTSGGTGGSFPPGPAEAAIVDSSSGSPTITLSGTLTPCASLTTTGATCTLTSTGTITLNGGMTLSATTTWSATGALTLAGTGTITTNGVSIASPITINGVSQTVTLGSALTTSGALTLTNGTLALNSFDARCLTFSSNNSNTRGVTFGSNYVNITSTSTATVLDIITATSFTPSGTGGFKLTGAASAVTRTIVVGTTGGAAATSPNVFVAAGSDTVAITTASNLGDLNFTGFTGTFAPAAAYTLYGSLTAASGMTWTTGTGTITFAATSTGKTITTAGKTLYAVTFNGVGGGWTFQDSFTCTNAFTLTAGALTLNSQTITVSTFVSNGSLTRSIAFGTSNINTTGTGTAINMGTSTAGFSYTGTGALRLTYSGATATTYDTSGTFTESTAPNISVTAGTYTLTMVSGSIVKNLNLTGFSGTFSGTAATVYSIYGSFTASSTMSVSANSFEFNFISTTTGNTLFFGGNVFYAMTFSGVGGEWTLQDNGYLQETNNAAELTLTGGSLVLNNFNFSCSVFVGTGTNVRSINFGTGYIIPNSVTSGTMVDISNATNFTCTGTGGFYSNNSLSSLSLTRTYVCGTTGGSVAGAPNLTWVNAVGANNVIAITSGSWFQNLDLTGSSATFAPPAALTLTGSLKLASTLTYTTGTGTITFAATSTGKTITTAGKSLYAVTFNGVGGGWTLSDALTATNVFTVTNGTFNSNNFNISASSYTLTGGAINMGSSTWYVLGTGTSWNRTGTTITANTSTIRFDGITSATITFAGGGATYNNLLLFNSASSGIFAITGANTFNTLTSNRTGGFTLTLPSSATTTVGTWSMTGPSPAGAITLNSSTPGVQATLSVASGTVNPIYAYIKDSNATGGATFVSTNAVDLGNNTGWGFSGTAGVLYWVGGTGTWSTSATNWSSTSGGTGGKPPPTSAIDVFFDGNSGSGTVSLSVLASNCKSLDTTGSSFTFAGTAGLSVYGNTFTLSPTTVWSATSQIFWAQTGGITTVTTNGVTMSSSFLQQGTGNPTVTLNGNLTATGSWSFNSGGINLNNYNLTLGSLSSLNGPTLTFGTGIITLTGANNPTNILNISTAITYTGSGTINISDSGSTARTIITPNTTTEAQSLSVNVTTGTYALTLTTGSVFNSLNFTGFAGSCAPAAAYTIYGSLALSSGMTWTTGTGTITFAATSTGKTITSAGKTLYAVTFAGVGGGWSLQDAMTAASTFTLTNGTFNANNFNVTASSYTLTAGAITMGSGTFTASGTGTVWSLTSTTVTPNTSTIVLSDTSTATKTFAGNFATYYNLQIGNGGGAATYTFIGSCTFNTISSNKTAAYTVTLESASTITVSNWTATGTSGNVLTLNAATAGVQAILALSGGGIVYGMDYLSIQDIRFTPDPSGTQRYVWYVGTNSTFVSFVSGALSTSDTTKIAYRLTTGTSWTVPADWNSANNNIYLIGGGGGGSGSVAASTSGNHVSGSGGGGGGFTAATNVTLTPSSSVTFAIGAAGTAGTGGGTTSSTAGAGGTTSFNSGAYSATGGGGASTTTTTTTVGSAGTGSTFNGGAGGLGNGTTNATRGGGGGGGSGGIDGAGQNGGNSVTTTPGTGGQGNNNVSNFLSISPIQYGDGAAGSINATTIVAAAQGFGGGGGGRGVTASVATTGNGSNGAQGIIFILYTTTTPPASSGNFFQFFL